MFSLITIALQAALDPAGPWAGLIDSLTRAMVYLLSAIFIVVMIVLALAAFRRRKDLPASDSDNAFIPPQHDREKRLSRTVTAGVVGTAAILFVLLVASFLVGRAIYSADKTNALVIEVTGRQWWWDVRYLNPIASQIVTTANEIHIPVGRPVVLRLGSGDVIHSFWVPNLHGKMDMIPGRTQELSLQADRPGVYRGQCAEYCGHQHAHMALMVVAVPETDFNAWYTAQLQPAPAPATESQSYGQKVFLSKPCVMCHRIQGTDAAGRLGPDLTHVASRQTIAAGTLHNTREHLQQWIVNSQSVKPGNRMPPIPVSGNDLNALLDYVQSLK